MKSLAHMLLLILLIATVRAQVAVPQARPDPEAQSAWLHMLKSKGLRTMHLSTFVVKESAHSPEILTFAHSESLGWWICLDNRPTVLEANVEVVQIHKGKAAVASITHKSEISKSVSLEISDSHRIRVLAIYDPGSSELNAVPTTLSHASAHQDVLTLTSGEKVLRFYIDTDTYLPVRFELDVPYRKLSSKSKELGPNAKTTLSFVLSKYQLVDGVEEPTLIKNGSVPYEVEFDANPRLPDTLFQIPIPEGVQRADAWR